MTPSAQPKVFTRSRKWLQDLISHHPAMLAEAISATCPRVRSQAIDWRSPRPPKYLEYRDGKALEALNLGRMRPALAAFWPARGPVWDALGVGIDTEERFLVEAKAHIPELVSSPTAAQGRSLHQIRRRLDELKRSLKSRAPADWSGAFYQYSNRLSYLDWFRTHGVSAFLVSVYFTDAPDVPEPATRHQWEGALSVVRSYMGLASHRLKPFIVDLFIDATTGRVAG
jgi:hypothetical protein